MDNKPDSTLNVYFIKKGTSLPLIVVIVSISWPSERVNNAVCDDCAADEETEQRDLGVFPWAWLFVLDVHAHVDQRNDRHKDPDDHEALCLAFIRVFFLWRLGLQNHRLGLEVHHRCNDVCLLERGSLPHVHVRRWSRLFHSRHCSNWLGMEQRHASTFSSSGAVQFFKMTFEMTPQLHPVACNKTVPNKQKLRSMSSIKSMTQVSEKPGSDDCRAKIEIH